jgi:hypothetical protein
MSLTLCAPMRCNKITLPLQVNIRADILAELETARLLALKRGQASSAVAATMGKAKILGLIVDRREVGDAGAFDHMTDEELVREAARMARELGIAGPHLVEDDNKKPL